MAKPQKKGTGPNAKKITKGRGGKGVLSNRQTRSQAKKGKPMIAANAKNGHARPASMVNDWSIAPDQKPKGDGSHPIPGVTEYLAEVRSRALKGKMLTATPLAKAIRNAYKSAKAGKQEKAILARIEAAQPAPTAQEIARALVASGIPAHRAGSVAMAWDVNCQEKRTAAREIFDRLHHAKAEGRNLLEAIAGPDPLKLATVEESGAALPKTSEECPAYVKAAFDKAGPEEIAEATAGALADVLGTWKPGFGDSFGGFGRDLLKTAGIPSEWINEIIDAAIGGGLDRNAAAREAEIERRKAEEPTKVTSPKVEASKTAEQIFEEEAEKIDEGDTEKRDELWHAIVEQPRVNRIARAYNLAVAQFHDVPDLVAEAVASEIIALGIITPGPFSLYVLPEYLKKAGVSEFHFLYIGAKLGQLGYDQGEDWQIKAMSFGHDLGPLGLKREHDACVLASFRPPLNPEQASKLLEAANIPQNERPEILRAFQEIQRQIHFAEQERPG